MKYRPEVDGLRALAILPVLLFHAGFEFFRSGFAGVDVFFVISGYLITGQIEQLLGANAFSLLTFYERRMRRLLPALYLMFLFCIAYMFLFQSPFFARDLSQAIVASVFFIQNFLLLYESNNYFDLASELKPLLHTWSLSVEEQFYIFFPFIMIFIYRFIPSYRYFFHLLLFIFGIYLFLGFEKLTTAQIFYLLPARTWQFALGSFAYYYLTHNTGRPAGKHAELLAALFLLLLLASFLLPIDAHPAYSSLLSSLCTFLLIIFASTDGYTKQILASRPLVAVGVMSYGLYLWHQPLLAILRQQLSPGVAGNSLALGGTLALSFLLAYVSLRYVERPARSKERLPTSTFFVSIALATLLFVSIGVWGHISWGFEPLKVAQIPAAKQELYISHQTEVRRNYRNGWGEMKPNDLDDTDIVVVGDSMAKDFAKSLSTAGFHVGLVGLDVSCMKQLSEGQEACGTTPEEIRRQTATAKTIVFSSDYATEPSLSGLTDLIEVLRQSHNVKVVGSFRFRNVSNLSYQYLRSRTEQPISGVFAENLDPRNAVNRSLQAIVGEANYIDKAAIFCPTKSQCNLYNRDHKPLFFDELHLTIEGQIYLGCYLRDSVRDWIGREPSKEAEKCAY